MSEGASKKVDVTVLGATGYTGGLVCEFLATQAGAEERSWAVAGRRKDALDELVKTHGAVSAVTADCTSEADCKKLAESSRVVLNLAGPYYERAEPLVRACAQAGTHYLDLSGELIFVRELIDAYHATAQQTGARIAPVSGYEALPFDLLALALVEGFIESWSESPARIDVLAHTDMPAEGAKGMSQMISGGTAETMRVMLEKDRSRLSADPAALNPTDDPEIETVRRAMRYELSPRPEDLEPMTVPMFPVPFLNPAIVDRTFALLRQEGVPIRPDIVYRERMSSRAFGPEWVRFPTSFMMAASNSFLGWMMNSSLDFPKRMMKSLIDWGAPKPGQGPDKDKLDDWAWSLTGRAQDESGRSVEMTLTAKGHPGYRTTANMIAEAGLILADPAADLPDRAGILTPALALGRKELPRFAAAGMEFGPLKMVEPA